jgi:hypothetical protein
MQTRSEQKTEQANPFKLRIVLGLFAALATVFVSIPFFPKFPREGLDASWEYALAEAVQHRLIFGRDFVFTFGPWGSVYTRLFHPATDHITLFGTALLGAALAAGVLLVARSRSILPVVILPVLVALVSLLDASTMAIPFLAMVACFQIAEGKTLRRWEIAAFCVLLSASGVLPLIKGSFSAVVLACLGVGGLLLIRAKRWPLLIVLVILPIISMCAGWIASGQPLAALPGFFISQKPIISGYTEAMAAHGSYAHVASILVADAIFLSALFGVTGNRINCRLLVVGALAFLFVAFKAGYVRQDAHDMIPAAALMLAVLACMDLLERRWLVASSIVAFLAWSYVTNAVVGNVALYVANRFEALPGTAIRGIQLRANHKMASVFDQAKAKLRHDTPLPPMPGPVDSYPVDLSILFAHDLNYSGRPVPQSYSAYTADIDQLNAAHLLGPRAPDHFLWRIGPLDGRYPTLEDATSWPLMLTRYKVESETPKYLVMERRDDAKPLEFRPAGQTTLTLNQPVEVPRSDSLVVATIDIRETFLGRMAKTLFRLPSVYIETTLENGMVLRNLYIPEMGKAGFIVSPFAGLNSELKLMSEGSQKLRVARFKIVAPDVGLWKTTAHVMFQFFDVSG